jgi:general secretion pathway protein A
MTTSNGAPDIREVFGLTAIPFTREIQTRWPSPHLDDIVSDFASVVSNRMIAALVAPSGTGKTLVLRTLAERLPDSRYRVHYLKVTSLSKRDLCREMAAVMGLEPVGSYPNLVRKLQDKVSDVAFVEGLRPVLLVDEAHDMRPDVLAILRIITNFEMDSKLVLSIVLAGQPPLAQMLAKDELVAVRQRIAHYATLRLLSREETKSYVEHRLLTAGARSVPFDASSLDAVYEISRGNFRAVDALSLKSLEVAAKKGVATVDPSVVMAARALLPS